MDIEHIKKIMKEKKITQNYLSEITQIPLQTIKCIMSGRTKYPRIDTVEAIEKALGIDFSQSNVNTAALDEKSTNTLTKKETRLLDAFNGLIPPMQDYVLEMVEKLVEKDIGKNKKLY